MSDPHPEPPWWKTGPGATVIAAVLAAVIAGIFGIVTSSTSRHTAAPNSIPPSSAAPPLTQSPTSEATTSEPAATAQPSGPQVRRHGKLVAIRDAATDLDTLQRDWGEGSSEFEIRLRYSYLVTKTTMWISSRKQADYQTCSDKSKIVRSIDNPYPNDLRANMNLCLETDEGRLALLHIDRITLDSTGDLNVIVFTATVWEKESP
jgi:hypothetical protein